MFGHLHFVEGCRTKSVMIRSVAVGPCSMYLKFAAFPFVYHTVAIEIDISEIVLDPTAEVGLAEGIG